MVPHLDEVDSESYRKCVRFYHSLYDYKGGVKPEKVLEQPGDINYQLPATALLKSQPRKSDLIGSSLLHLAQSFKNKKMFNLLLQTGADFTLQNSTSWTVLHQSIHYRYDDFKDDRRPGWFQAKIEDEFGEAVLTAHVTSNNFNNPSDNNGISHFHIACWMDHYKSVELFLNNGISVNQIINEDSPILSGYTPLHVAAICGCLETTKVLLKYGADTTIKEMKGLTPLRCVVNRNIEIIDWMHTRNTTIFCFAELNADIIAKEKIINLITSETANGSDNVIDDVGFSFFHAVCTLKDTSNAEKFLANGVDVHHFVNMNSPVWPGYTALHFAAHFNIEMVKLLLSKGANMVAKDAYGVTPFDVCAERYSIKDLHSILSSHESWKDIKLSDGTTKLIDLVYIMQNPEQMSTFVETGDLNVNLFVPQDSPIWPGYSTLHLAIIFTETIKIVSDYPSDIDDDCWSMGSDCDERLSKRPRHMTTDSYIQRIKICLNNGADVTAKDATGSTPLHLAFRLQTFDAISLMFEFHPEKVNPIDKDNLSHLYIACYANDTSLIEKMLSSGADVNISVSSTFHWHGNENSFINKYRSAGFKSGGLTPLHGAVRSGNKDITDLLLKHGADVNMKDDNGMTPLHLIFTCHYNHDIADILLESPNLRDSVFNDALSHLHLACFFKNEEGVKTLINNGAAINTPIVVTPNSIFKNYNEWSYQPLAFMVEHAGCTPLHIAVGLYPREMQHIPFGSATIAKLLLQNGANMFIGNAIGLRVAYMSLTRRYLKGSEDIEITFLENDVTLQKRMLEDSGITMLHIACWKVNIEMVKAYLSKGIDVNAQAHPDSPVWPKWTPMHVLMVMAANSKVDNDNIIAIMKVLLENGADLTLTNAELDTPLHLTEPGRLSIEIVNRVSYYTYANSPYLDMLLERLKDNNTNPSNIAGISLLHIACLRNDVGHINRLLLAGADVNKPIDFFSKRYPGLTPLHLALHSETSMHSALRIATVELLIKHGADVQAPDMYGSTSFHYAVKLALPSKTLLELILSAGADFNAINIRGESAFELLLKSENLNIEDIKYFLQRGCRLTSFNPFSEDGYIGILLKQPLAKDIISTWKEVLEIDANGRTAIHNAVSIKNCQVENYSELIGILTTRGCDIDHQDNQGKTALHLAVKIINFKAAFGLIKQGIDVNVADADGKTAFATCFEYHHQFLTFCVGNYPSQILKCIAHYVQKMQLCGLDVNELNMKILNDIPRECKPDEVDIKIFDKELEKAKRVKTGPQRLPIYNFLSGLRAWESLRISLDDPPSSVEELFILLEDRNISYDFPEFINILKLQYRKFLKARIQFSQ